MAGPSKVEFPGKQKQRIRMRGTKKASGSVQKKLAINLTKLLEEPGNILPTITGPTSSGFLRPDKMKKCLNEMRKVIDKRENLNWLRKRMTARKGNVLARSLAGSFAAAHEDNIDTVSIFKHPVYGSSSYVRRGNGLPAHLFGLQMNSNPQFRLIAWEELARSGYWFFSWGENFECTGVNPNPPKKWIKYVLDKSPLKLVNENNQWVSGKGENNLEITLGSDEIFISLDSLSTNKDSFVQSIALYMSPPRLGNITEVKLNYKPEGWPEEKHLDENTVKAMDEVIDKWLLLEIDDKNLENKIHDCFCENIEDGLILNKKWFDIDDREGFLSELQGSEIEIEAVGVILDNLDGGVRINAAEEAHWLSNEIVHLNGNSAHVLLKATWGKYGMAILENMFSLSGKKADNIFEQQLKSKRAFSGFLKDIENKQSSVRMLKKFPWDSEKLPSPLDFADLLIKTARSEGIGKTTTMARKTADESKSSMGWAWVCTHGKNEGEAWHYEPTVRDKGGDWVPALKALWDASGLVIEKSDIESYVEAMKKLRQVAGIIEELPPID